MAYFFVVAFLVVVPLFTTLLAPVAVFLAPVAVFLAAGFLATAFLAAGFLAEGFLAAGLEAIYSRSAGFSLSNLLWCLLITSTKSEKLIPNLAAKSDKFL